MSDLERIRDLERRLREVENQIGKLPVRVSGGSGGSNQIIYVQDYASLPASVGVPTFAFTGVGGVWYYNVGSSWIPLVVWLDAS